MKTLQEVISRYADMTEWVLTGEAASDHRDWVFPAELDGEHGIKRVKNLGWLLKHSGEIVHPLQGLTFYVKGWRYGSSSVTIPPSTIKHEYFRPILFANLVDGRTFAAQWMDASLLREWLDRPSFRGFSIEWDLNAGTSKGCIVGDNEYRSVDVRQRVPIF